MRNLKRETLLAGVLTVLLGLVSFANTGSGHARDADLHEPVNQIAQQHKTEADLNS